MKFWNFLTYISCLVLQYLLPLLYLLVICFINYIISQFQHKFWAVLKHVTQFLLHETGRRRIVFHLTDSGMGKEPANFIRLRHSLKIWWVQWFWHLLTVECRQHIVRMLGNLIFFSLCYYIKIIRPRVSVQLPEILHPTQ